MKPGDRVCWTSQSQKRAATGVAGLIAIKQVRPGESFRLLVTVLKTKKGVPTVIRVSGREYVLRPADQYGNRKKAR